jgi:hypothetical protein
MAEAFITVSANAGAITFCCVALVTAIVPVSALPAEDWHEIVNTERAAGKKSNRFFMCIITKNHLKKV